MLEVEAIGMALWAIIPGEAMGFFDHRGHPFAAQRS
jgi:hypothetical protein